MTSRFSFKKRYGFCRFWQIIRIITSYLSNAHADASEIKDHLKVAFGFAFVPKLSQRNRHSMLHYPKKYVSYLCKICKN